MIRAAVTGIVTACWLIAGMVRPAGVSGFVVDAETGETIIGVNVSVVGTDIGAATDHNGWFHLSGIQDSVIILRFQHIAYSERTLEVNISKGSQFLHRISIAHSQLLQEAISVKGYQSEVINKDLDISSFEVNPAILKEVPQFDKDVFKMVRYSPSVTISDPISPQYYVRGSDPGENLVQLDGMTIYNPQHIMSLGAVFNPYAIKNIEMLVGGFGAEYGGRNSSILYITSREGHQDEIHGVVKPATSGMEGAVEFPVKPGTTAMFSGRLYSSLPMRVIYGSPNLMADFNGALQTRFRNTQLRMSSFYARDYYDYKFKKLAVYLPEDHVLQDFDNGYLLNSENLALGINARSILSPSLVLENHFYTSQSRVRDESYFEMFEEDSVNNVDIILSFDTMIKNRITDFTAKSSLTWFTPWFQNLTIGTEINDYSFFNSTGQVSLSTLQSEVESRLVSVYFQDQIEIQQFLLQVGLRSSKFDPENKWRTEPRISWSWRLPAVTIKAAWGEYRQYLTVMNTQDYQISQYLDYYYPLRNIQPLFSRHFIMGLEGRINAQFDYSLTAYQKDMPVLYRYEYGNTADALYSYEAALERGKGDAHGLELLLRGRWKNFSGWITYSYSEAVRSFPSIQNGKEYLYDGDQTHSLKSVLMVNLTEDITGSFTIQFTSGYPKTWETGRIHYYQYDPVSNTYGVYPQDITPVKNNVRYPARMLIEAGWVKKLRDGFGARLGEFMGSEDVYSFVKIQNILILRRNPAMYIYIPDYGYYAYDYLNVIPIPQVSFGWELRF